MHIVKYCLATIFLIGTVACGHLKLLALKKPHFGVVGLKWRKPKLLGHGGGFGGAGFGGGHSSGYEHHEYHSSHHSSGGGGFGGVGGKFGFLGR